MKMCCASFVLLLAWMFCYPGSCGIGNYVACPVCGKPAGDAVYLVTDKVTRARIGVCEQCAFFLPRCFICGVPALTNAAGFVQFEDRRALCARDARTAVVREEEGVQIGAQIREQLDREFSRFLSLPETNISFCTIDRLNLESLFKTVGYDYDCPNVFGITQPTTNAGRVDYKISVLIGLPRADFKSVCAHECAHVWLEENLSESRRKLLSVPAREGFCELLAYLCMDRLHDEGEKEKILANAYTRGQVALFVEAEKTYGLGDVVEWMRFGADDRLKAGELLRVRTLEAAAEPNQSPPPMPVTWITAPPRVYRDLTLKAIFWDPKRPTALLNERTLAAGEQATLRVGSTNLTFRCLEIRKDRVRVKVLDSGEEKLLRLGAQP